MKLSLQRETLLKPLQAVVGVVERRQTMPILANFLMSARDGRLSVTATDLEVELMASVDIAIDQDGDATLPGRKLLDICKALPEGAKVSITVDGERATVRSGRSRFTLATLPAAEFPVVESVNPVQTLTLSQKDTRRILDKTHFAMAQQDVRYFLNGLLLEVTDTVLRAVATDGHRLSLCEMPVPDSSGTAQQVIVPRKGIIELQRLLRDDGDMVIAIGSNHVRVEVDDIRFTSKLIDGRFPEYERVIPRAAESAVLADRMTLHHALQRTAILSNEKYRGVRLLLEENVLTIQAHNPEQEEAEEQVEIDYTGESMEIGFNVNYLLDALGAVDTETVELGLADANRSCLIQEPGADDCKFVVMPMRL